MVSSLWPLELLVFSPQWIYLSVEIQFLWNGASTINDGTHGYYEHHIRHDKFLTVCKFDGASAICYILITTWLIVNSKRSGSTDIIPNRLCASGFFH